jgi:hypothetical protein
MAITKKNIMYHALQEIQYAREAAVRAARKEFRGEAGVIRSRKASIVAMDYDGNRIGEPEEFRGTLKQIIDIGKHENAAQIFVFSDVEQAPAVWEVGDILDGCEWAVCVAEAD